MAQPTQSMHAYGSAINQGEMITLNTVPLLNHQHSSVHDERECSSHLDESDSDPSSSEKSEESEVQITLVDDPNIITLFPV